MSKTKYISPYQLLHLVVGFFWDHSDLSVIYLKYWRHESKIGQIYGMYPTKTGSIRDYIKTSERLLSFYPTTKRNKNNTIRKAIIQKFKRITGDIKHKHKSGSGNFLFLNTPAWIRFSVQGHVSLYCILPIHKHENEGIIDTIFKPCRLFANNFSFNLRKRLNSCANMYKCVDKYAHEVAFSPAAVE